MKKLHLKTNQYLFLFDIENTDETSGIEMFDYDGKLISNNFLAYNFLHEILAGDSDQEIVFISKELEIDAAESIIEWKLESNLKQIKLF